MKLNNCSHNTPNQNTKHFIKKWKFCDSLHTRGKCLAYGNVCNVCNKENHCKIYCQRVGKKGTWNWKGSIWWTFQPQRLWTFFETIIMRNSVHINQIRNENSDYSITLPSNEVPSSYNIDTGAQCNVNSFDNFKNFWSWTLLLSSELKFIHR